MPVFDCGVVGAGLCHRAGALVEKCRGLWHCQFLRVVLSRHPLLIQILLIYLGLPQLGLVPGAIAAGIIALSLNYGAYLSEIFRAGILGVPHGQREAALALGMRDSAIFWHVTLPQAMRTIIPPTTNQFISMLKDSSLISVMGVWEVMFLAQSYGRSSYRYIEMLTTAAIIYWMLSIGLELIQARMERHYGKGYVRRG